MYTITNYGSCDKRKMLVFIYNSDKFKHFSIYSSCKDCDPFLEPINNCKFFLSDFNTRVETEKFYHYLYLEE